MSIYRYKLTSENIRSLFIYLDLLINCVPSFANYIVRLGLLADHKVMPGNHTSESLTDEYFREINGLNVYENRCMILGILTRIICDFFVVKQGSYMIS